MIISQALLKAQAVLASRLEAEMLLAFCMKTTREFLMAHPEAHVPLRASKKFRLLCAKRSRGIPLAYLTGLREFFGLDFAVTPDTLIPRPETEAVVERVISLARGFKKPKILDLGTGCGCIAVALAKRLPRARITASDISAAALAVARDNAKRHRVGRRIRFVRGNLLQPFSREAFDIIAANLPYVPRRQRALVEPEVKKYEPASALWGGPDGLLLIGKFLRQVKALEFPPAAVVCEFGFSMKRAVERLMRKLFPGARVQFHKDLAKRDRLVMLYP